jgi:uncharacterized membrane protein
MSRKDLLTAIPAFVTAFLGLVTASHAAPPKFLPLGDLAGGEVFSQARDVSADGSKVVGLSKSTAQASGEAFLWTGDAGMTGLGSAGTFLPFSVASAITADGSVIVGTTTSPGSALEGFAYSTDSAEWTLLGFLPGLNFSRAFDVTIDGNDDLVVVGYSRLIFKEAYRWTEAGGMVGLGLGLPEYNNSRAFGVSADGSKVSGFLGEIFEPEMEAFRWTQGSNTIAPLGFGQSGDTSDASSISASGTVVAGTAAFGPDFQAFRWAVGNPVIASIGALPGATDSEALAISADGKTIVGSSGGRAFMWNADRALDDPASAMIDVQAALAGVGFDLTGWTLVTATSVADDGQTIVGNAINPDGNQEAFLATVPLDSDPLAIISGFAPIATGPDFSCAIQSGALVCWGNFDPDPAPGLTFTQIAAGDSYVCGIQTSGLTFCTGGVVPPGDLLGKISAGEFACGLDLGGNVRCFGGAVPGTQPPTGRFVELSVGRDHGCAVRDDLELVCFGADDNGKATPPELLGPVVSVAAGDEHTCALREDKQVSCFGLGTLGQPSDDGQASPPEGTFSKIAAGSLHTCGVRTPAEGETAAGIDCWGAGADQADFQSTPPKGKYSALDAGGTSFTGHACAIAAGDGISCWGQNADLQACPPGDTDCDGIPDASDNCPNDFNPEQVDVEADGIGDVCDLCVGPGIENFDPDGDPLNQADEDGDGRGDLCDICLGDPNPTCDPVEFKLIDNSLLNGGGAGAGGAVAAGGFGTAATTPIDFSLLISCGDQASVSKMGLAIALPSGVLPSEVTFGNDCGSTGCPNVGGVQTDPPAPPELPEGLLSDRVDPDSLDTFVFKPGEAPAPANPDYMYFSLRAESSSAGLCTQNETDIFVARITVGDLTEGFTPPFSTQGTQDVVGDLAESEGELIDDTKIELESGNPDPQITIAIVPDIYDQQATNRFAIHATSNVDIWRVFFALQGNGDLQWLGCQTPTPGGDFCTPELPRFDCQSTGTVPVEQLGPNVDYSSDNSFVLGPVVSGLPGVADNALYVSLEAKVNVGIGSLRSFNPSLLPVERTTKLGTVQFNPTDPNQAGSAPALLFAGVQTVFDRDREGDCSTAPAEEPFFPFQVTDFGRANFGVSEASSTQTFSFGLDPDGDHYASDYDDCPFKANDQSDNGGFESSTNAGGASANGIGDACECGEVIGFDGKVRENDDTGVIQQILIGGEPGETVVERCSTIGTPECGPEDWAASWRAHRIAGEEVSAACAPALP